MREINPKREGVRVSDRESDLASISAGLRTLPAVGYDAKQVWADLRESFRRIAISAKPPLEFRRSSRPSRARRSRVQRVLAGAPVWRQQFRVNGGWL